MGDTPFVNVSVIVQLKTFPEYDAANYVWKYVSPFLLVIGTLGSGMSICVLSRSRLRSATMTFYLIQLACNDIIVLNTGLLYYWVKNTFGFNLRTVSGFACKAHTFAVTLFLDYSSWIMVLLTLDRCICACLPLRASKICTMRNAKLVSVLVFVMLIGVNMHFFWTHDIVARELLGKTKDCYTPSRYAFFFEYVFMWIDFCVFSLFPFLIMITCNALILRELKRSSKRLKAYRNQSSLSTMRILENVIDDEGESPEMREEVFDVTDEPQPSPLATDVKPQDNLPEMNTNQNADGKVDGNTQEVDADVEICSLVSDVSSQETEVSPTAEKAKRKITISMDLNMGKHFQKMRSKMSQQWKPSKLAVMLLSINCTFLLLTSPIVIYQIGLIRWSRNDTTHRQSQLMLVWAVVNILQYTDNAIHFFQYYLAVPTFRKVFISVMKCRGKSGIDNSITSY